jgi:hypothetical protein
VTLPRPVEEGDTVMTAKRCIAGQFRLRPDRDVVGVYLYVLGYAQQTHGVLLHEFCTMSNHDHPYLTDPRGLRPRFIQMLHSLTARAINHRFGEWDSLWSGQRHAAVKLLEAEDKVQRSVDVLANAVEAGLVRYASDWQGATSWHLEYGEELVVKKPPFFFSEHMPDEVTIVLTRPEGIFPGLSDREARAEVRRLVKQREREVLAEMRAQGRSFMGMRRVLRQPRHNTPNSNRARRGIRPHIGCRSKWARIEALRDLEKFWAEHERCRLAFKAGHRNIAFPPGTFLMKVVHGVRVASRAPP